MPLGGAGVPWYGDIAFTFPKPEPRKQTLVKTFLLQRQLEMHGTHGIAVSPPSEQ